MANEPKASSSSDDEALVKFLRNVTTQCKIRRLLVICGHVLTDDEIDKLEKRNQEIGR